MGGGAGREPRWEYALQPRVRAFCLGYLFAYELDGTTGALSQNPIWPSSLPTNNTVPDFASTPFASPTAAHGRVYVPTFGLCSSLNGSGNCTGAAYANYQNSGVEVYTFPQQ